MAITSSAKKEIRGSARRRVFNLFRLRSMRSSIKKLKKGDTDVTYKDAQKAIDKAVKRGVIKKNTGARKKSRLVKFLKAK